MVRNAYALAVDEQINQLASRLKHEWATRSAEREAQELEDLDRCRNSAEVYRSHMAQRRAANLDLVNRFIQWAETNRVPYDRPGVLKSGWRIATRCQPILGDAYLYVLRDGRLAERDVGGRLTQTKPDIAFYEDSQIIEGIALQVARSGLPWTYADTPSNP
jgi:hypothetical protein